MNDRCMYKYVCGNCLLCYIIQNESAITNSLSMEIVKEENSLFDE